MNDVHLLELIEHRYALRPVTSMHSLEVEEQVGQVTYKRETVTLEIEDIELHTITSVCTLETVEDVYHILETPVAVIPGPQGPAGPAGIAKTHVQSIASTLWVINHDLGFRPSVTLFTVGGVQFQAQVNHPSTIQTLVQLNSPMAGTARLN